MKNTEIKIIDRTEETITLKVDQDLLVDYFGGEDTTIEDYLYDREIIVSDPESWDWDDLTITFYLF
jgi:hypothetical protein